MDEKPNSNGMHFAKSRDMENSTQKTPRPPFPKQKLDKPGIEAEMKVRPKYEASSYRAAEKLIGQCALVTGGDSGIGRAVAVLYAREGADVAITHLPEEQGDAEETRKAIEGLGRKCLTLQADLSNSSECRRVIGEALKGLGKLDILVSNAAHQNSKENIEDVSDEEWELTFKTNVGAYFHLVKAALPHLHSGAS